MFREYIWLREPHGAREPDRSVDVTRDGPRSSPGCVSSHSRPCRRRGHETDPGFIFRDGSAEMSRGALEPRTARS